MKAATVRRIYWILSAALALLVAMEAVFARPHHPVFPWHRLVGYNGLIGLAGCIAVVLISKALGSIFLQRPEDYDADR